MTGPGGDAILLAGRTRCGVCGHTGFPVDALWLDDGLILASYAASCAHQEPVAFVLDPAELAPDLVWCGAIAASTGAPCRHKSAPGSGLCPQHQQARAGGR